MLTLLFEWLGVIALTSARILPCFLFLPFLNSNVIHNTVRYPVAFAICFALFPFMEIDDKPSAMSLIYYMLLLKELLIGVSLAVIFSIPFWTLYIVGNVIDQQRGATLSSTYDPLSGIDSSELASFLNLFAALLFLLQGGLLYILEVLQSSYRVFDPLSFTLPHLSPFLGLLNLIIGKGLVLASPVLAAFFMVEIILGLLSRYSPQMNAFSLAMSVKSLMAFFILLLYLVVVSPNTVSQLSWPHFMATHYFPDE